MNELTKWSKQMEKSPLYKAEIDLLSKITPNFRGYHLLLLGSHKPLDWLPSHCLHAFTLSPDKTTYSSHIQSSFITLPLRESSVDVAILPYLLEYVDEPELLLEELSRILISNGKIILFGFNRLHPWNWIHSPNTKTQMPLWLLKNKLNQMNFEIDKIHWIRFGTVYLIEAQKKVAGVTPLKPLWKTPEIEKAWQPTARKMG